MRSDLIEANEIVVNGALISSVINSNHVRVTGIIKSNILNAMSINVNGLTDVRNISAIETRIHGRINSFKVSSKKIFLNLSGVSRIDEIEAEELIIRSITQYGVRGRILTRKIYAIEAYSEFLVAELFVCCQCSIGDFNRINRFIYGNIISVSPTSSFNEKPLGISELCEAKTSSELRFAVPT